MVISFLFFLFFSFFLIKIISVFSLGMTMYELMTLEYPYYDCPSPIAIVSAILDGKEPTLSNELKDMYAPILTLWRKCIAILPANRVTAGEVRDQLLEIKSDIDKDRYRRKSMKLKENVNREIRSRQKTKSKDKKNLKSSFEKQDDLTDTDRASSGDFSGMSADLSLSTGEDNDSSAEIMNTPVVL